HLTQVILARGGLGVGPGFGERRQQRRQNGNHRDDDEEFDQCEANGAVCAGTFGIGIKFSSYRFTTDTTIGIKTLASHKPSPQLLSARFSPPTVAPLTGLLSNYETFELRSPTMSSSRCAQGT